MYHSFLTLRDKWTDRHRMAENRTTGSLVIYLQRQQMRYAKRHVKQ